MITVLFTGRSLRERHRETVLHPPEGVSYRTLLPLDRLSPDYKISAGHASGFSRSPFLKKLGYFFAIPNVRWIPRRFLVGVDLVHTPGQFILNRAAYVVEIDNVACLAFYHLGTLQKRFGLLKRLLKHSCCKKIICISEAARASVVNTFRDAEIAGKCEVVYPYVALNPHQRRKEFQDKVILLSANTKFYMKGTREVLAAFEEVHAKYPHTELWIVSNTPKEYGERYRGNPHIKFFPATFSKEQLYRDFYSQCDIFVQPSYQDSFGLVYLELLASGKPIVTTDLFAIPELVIDGHNGLLIKAPFYMYNPDFTLRREYFPISVEDTEEDFYKRVDGRTVVQDLITALSVLIEDGALRKRMGENALQLVRTKFSDAVRRSKLGEIYRACLS